MTSHTIKVQLPHPIIVPRSATLFGSVAALAIRGLRRLAVPSQRAPRTAAPLRAAAATSAK
jgi:hypothetical protein